MPGITAFLHVTDDALRLGRTLETLRPCDEILIVDGGSRDSTVRIAREYGAHVCPLQPGAAPNQYLQHARQEWILCLEPGESLTEGLEASLFEWKSTRPDSTGNLTAFSVFLREETAEGWSELPAPQVRLVPRNWARWQAWLPAATASATILEGKLLRFLRP
jgi:glycosyltransferase involved in cell wall biosynthesis